MRWIELFCVMLFVGLSMMVIAADEAGIPDINRLRKEISSAEAKAVSRLKALRDGAGENFIIKGGGEVQQIMGLLSDLAVKRPETIAELILWVDYKEEFPVTTEKMTQLTRSSVARALCAAGPAASFALLAECKEKYSSKKVRIAILILDKLLGDARAKLLLKDLVDSGGVTGKLASSVKEYLKDSTQFLQAED